MAAARARRLRHRARSRAAHGGGAVGDTGIAAMRMRMRVRMCVAAPRCGVHGVSLRRETEHLQVHGLIGDMPVRVRTAGVAGRIVIEVREVI